MTTDVLIVGGGYSGCRVARQLIDAGLSVAVTRRSSEAGDVASIAVDLDSDETPALPSCRRVLYLVPPADGDEDPRLTRLLEALPRAPERIVLASTSGVYGDCGGALVNETWPTRPETGRAQRRVSQERTLCRFASENGIQRCVLRVAGIYGPGRLPLERLRAGEPVLAESDSGPGNRIHVDDLVSVMLAALEQRLDSEIYNVSDGNHASSTEFYRRVAAAAGLPGPREIDRDEARTTFGETRLSFLTESRRLDTERLLTELAPALRYADLDDGIRASLDSR